MSRWLTEDLAIPLDLEASCEQTCRDLRIARGGKLPSPQTASNAFCSMPFFDSHQIGHCSLLPLPPALAATVAGRVAGYILYRAASRDTYITIDNLAVCRDLRHDGIGKALVNCVTGYERPIRTFVSETNLGAQLFFKALGFKCTSTKKLHPESPLSNYTFELLPADWEARQNPEIRAGRLV